MSFFYVAISYTVKKRKIKPDMNHVKNVILTEDTLKCPVVRNLNKT